MKKYNIAVVGVGAVGIEILDCLTRREFPVSELRVFARTSRDIKVNGRDYRVEAIDKADLKGVEIALFAGTEGEKGAAKLYSGNFTEQGAVVIDNGADFRLDRDVPLVVPEANRDDIFCHKGIIANPNCTTIQMIAALAGIQKQLGLERILLTSFQAVSGAGKNACLSLWDELNRMTGDNRDKDFGEVNKKLKGDFKVFGSQIAGNVIPQIGGFGPLDYTSEEWKVVNETRKIFGDDSINISATCARVPVFTSHCEAVYFQTKQKADTERVKNILSSSPGVEFLDKNQLPLPVDVEGTDKVYVSRLRGDPFNDNCFWIWIVADNLRKGAALNAVQIAEALIAPRQ